MPKTNFYSLLRSSVYPLSLPSSALCLDSHNLKVHVKLGTHLRRPMYTSSRRFRVPRIPPPRLMQRAGTDTSSHTKTNLDLFRALPGLARRSPLPSRLPRPPLLPKKKKMMMWISLVQTKMKTRRPSGSKLSVSRNMPRKRRTNPRRSPRSVVWPIGLSFN